MGFPILVRCHLYIESWPRSLIAQFRAGILPLNIEVGRYRNVPLEEHLCMLCDDNVVEDEVNFLCLCQLNTEARCIICAGSHDV